jgi:archaemetzincin
VPDRGSDGLLQPRPSGAPASEPAGLIVPIGPVDSTYLDFLALVLPETIGIPFRQAERALPVDHAYDAVRRQWNAARILGGLDAMEEARGARFVLGVAEVDLFIPILTFVFGLAHLGARCALVSLHRLRMEFYGLPPDPELLLARLEKEAVHEIGHTLRLTHCPDYGCVMHYSNAVEEVDLKGAGFCPECRKKSRRG